MVFAADKCGPGAYNLPIYLAFADPMYCAGLMLPPMIRRHAAQAQPSSFSATPECHIFVMWLILSSVNCIT